VRGRLAVRYSDAQAESFVADAAVRDAVAAIAVWTLLGRRGYSPAVGADKSIELRYRAALDWIEQAAGGDALLLTSEIDRRGPLVAGSGESDWHDWRRCWHDRRRDGRFDGR
jgi:hypothetical protein